MRSIRFSARTRLTVIYLGLFVLAGVAVVAVNYTLLASHLHGASLDLGATRVGNVTGSNAVHGGAIDSPSLSATASATPEVVHALLRDRSNALSALLRISVLTLLGAAVVTGICVWFVSHRVLRPLAEMRTAATRITDRNLDERLPVRGPRDELRDLASTFNQMMDRLTAAFTHERRLVANASHELGTPIANQQAVLDVALADPDASADELRRACEAARAESLRAGRLLRGMLSLAQAQHAELITEPVRLDEVITDAVAEIASDDVRINYTAAPCTVEADRFLLERLLSNLMINAITHGDPDNRWVRIDVAPTDVGPTLTVTNACKPLDPSMVAGLVEPFRRGHADRTGSRTGSGLGLSIVQAIAQAHGWTLTVTTSGPTFIVEIGMNTPVKRLG